MEDEGFCSLFLVLVSFLLFSSTFHFSNPGAKTFLGKVPGAIPSYFSPVFVVSSYAPPVNGFVLEGYVPQTVQISF